MRPQKVIYVFALTGISVRAVVVVVVAAAVIDAIGARRSVRLRPAPFCNAHNAARTATFATLRWLLSQCVFFYFTELERTTRNPTLL